jgi:hypothetical protein
MRQRRPVRGSHAFAARGSTARPRSSRRRAGPTRPALLPVRYRAAIVLPALGRNGNERHRPPGATERSRAALPETPSDAVDTSPRAPSRTARACPRPRAPAARRAAQPRPTPRSPLPRVRAAPAHDRTTRAHRRRRAAFAWTGSCLRRHACAYATPRTGWALVALPAELGRSDAAQAPPRAYKQEVAGSSRAPPILGTSCKRAEAPADWEFRKAATTCFARETDRR